MGFIDISKQKTIKDKVYVIIDEFDNNKLIDDIEEIIIEDSLSSFASGFTSVQTIIKLAKINAVIAFVLEWTYDTKVNLVNPNTARKSLFGKARIKGKPAKEYVKEQVENMFNVSTFIKMNKRGNPDKRNIDAYDALVCALYELKN
jgi:Holliday junction resolvasome RuvABC endonuclease subunit